MFFVILVDDVYCVAIHDLSPVLTALFFIELGGFNNDNLNKLEHFRKCTKNIIDVLSISFLKIWGAKNNPVRSSSDQY